jgi:hypothetical protein
MWIFIILLVVITIIFISFNSDRQKQIQKIDSEGGMRKKYSILINHLCGSRGEILRQSGSTIIVGASSIGGTTNFIITAIFGSI